MRPLAARRLDRHRSRLRLPPEAQGKGYATEACIAAMDYAFDVLGWNEVIHNIDADNAASQAVARKLGATVLRRIDHAPPFDELIVDVWGQTREQWRARRAANERTA